MTIQFWHPLPRETMRVVPNRKTFVLEASRGRKVLHVGCVDTGVLENRLLSQSHLHMMLLSVAERAWGVDVNREGIELMARLGVPDLHAANGEDLSRLELGDRPDLILASEVLEHVSNPGDFLDSLRAFDCEVLISVPNAFSGRSHICVRNGQEFVHPDHNYYFSYVTLKALIEKHGFKLLECAGYYWPTNDEIGRELEQLIARQPFFAEGLIFRIVPAVAQLDDRRGRNVIAAGLDLDGIEQLTEAYLGAFAAGEDVALHLLVGDQVGAVHERLVAVLERLGLDPETIPDVVVSDRVGAERELQAGSLVVGPAPVVARARELGLLATEDLAAEALRRLLAG